MKKLTETFDRLHARTCRAVGEYVPVLLALGPDEDFPQPRNMAYTMRDGDTKGLTVVVSRKLCGCPEHNIEGVLAHEFGHVVLMHMGKVKHPEREADMVAERMFGKPIFYDHSTVQSTHAGARPRPRHLPS
jgi:hypothetical protein